MKKWFLYGASFFSVYLLFVLATIPAAVLLNFVELPNEVKIQNINGSLWRSNIDQIQYQQEVINDVEVNVSVFSLLAFNPTADITFGGAFVDGPEGQLSLSGFFGELTASELSLQLPANKIAMQLSLPVPVKAHSNVDINIEQFVIGKPYCKQAQGNISWQKAAITALDEKVELGALAAKISCQQGVLALDINPNNDLGLTFSLILAKNSVSGNGYLTPGNKFPQQLTEVLPFLGKADNEGRYKLYF